MPDPPFLVFELPEHYGWLSILPPVSAIVLAIATRRVILSLLFGVFVGVVLVQL